MDERLSWLPEAGDLLERLSKVVDFKLLRPELDAALGRSDRAKGGRPPYDPVLMFKVLVLQGLSSLSDDQAEYQLRNRLSSIGYVLDSQSVRTTGVGAPPTATTAVKR